jgi:hypothetical protein
MIGKNSEYKERLFVAGFLVSQLETEALRYCFVSVFPDFLDNHYQRSILCKNCGQLVGPAGIEELKV